MICKYFSVLKINWEEHKCNGNSSWTCFANFKSISALKINWAQGIGNSTKIEETDLENVLQICISDRSALWKSIAKSFLKWSTSILSRSVLWRSIEHKKKGNRLLKEGTDLDNDLHIFQIDQLGTRYREQHKNKGNISCTWSANISNHFDRTWRSIGDKKPLINKQCLDAIWVQFSIQDLLISSSKFVWL